MNVVSPQIFLETVLIVTVVIGLLWLLATNYGGRE